MRNLVAETSLGMDQLIYPIFVRYGKDDVRPITSMPRQFQWTLDKLGAEIRDIKSRGIKAVMPFGIPEHKDPEGSDNLSANGIMANAIRLIKNTCPEMMVISDICLCDYSSWGHCCIVDPSNKHLLNEPTLRYLAKAAVNHVQAGADMVAPSGMIDGMVASIRQGLNEASYIYTPIMSYAVKYASSFYGPFREAAECAPQFGDRSSYQMDPRNSKEALKEVSLDIAEGCDVVMVKPALPYLDVIKNVSESFDVPVAAYQVSGEYAMIEAAAEKGWIDKKRVALESLGAIKRAGATSILTYFAKDMAEWLA
jgi:porphobilinogen synthase